MSSTAGFGDGAFAFGAWDTPFANNAVEISDVIYSALSEELLVRVHLESPADAYSVRFHDVAAFRVLDEHGLLEYWAMTSQLGDRPARSTFRVRNSLWSKESTLSFVRSDGWSFVLATDWDCVEVITTTEPIIAREEPPVN